MNEQFAHVMNSANDGGRTGVIHILDANTANKIAAGEVVERPASIVKELVENSLDAGSSKIDIEISDGGSSFIRITDDGSGMSRDDAELAVLRHATSKIRYADDLFSIATLGFRGEALPSIAAVSRFCLTTRTQEQDIGWLVTINGGVIEESRETGAACGTTVTVTDLFFNTPARKKFLKSPSAESGHIHDIVGKLALTRPDVRFSLINNGRLTLTTPGTNSVQDTIFAIYGKKLLANELIAVNYQLEQVMISGYIGAPSVLKSNRSWQTVVVNSRVIYNRMIGKALDNAYHSLLPRTGYPFAVLSILIPSDTLDVNVHPQKNEVKFGDDSQVYRAVFHAVSKALQAPQDVSQLAAKAPIAFDAQPLFTSGQNYSASLANALAKPAYWHEATPVISSMNMDQGKLLNTSEAMGGEMGSAASIAATIQHGSPGGGTMSHPDSVVTSNDSDVKIAAAATDDLPSDKLVLQPIGQFDSLYILANGHDGMYIVDQHAAHERILYERFSTYLNTIPAQQLLHVLYLPADDWEMDIIQKYADLFLKMGLRLEAAGPNTIRLLESPADIPEDQVESIVREVFVHIQNMHNPTAQEIRHCYLQMAACRAAVKAGDLLNIRQMQALLDELCAASLPFTCPHGRPAIVRISKEDMAKMFRR